MDDLKEREKEVTEETEDICAICREGLINPDMIEVVLECKHAFHMHCIGSAFNRADGIMRCPYCFKVQYPGRWALHNQDTNVLGQTDSLIINNNDNTSNLQYTNEHIDIPPNNGNTFVVSNSNPNNTICAICKSSAHTVSMITTTCGHHYHLHCIGSYFNRQKKMECFSCGSIDSNTPNWRYCEGFKHDDIDFDDFDAVPPRVPIELKPKHVVYPYHKSHTECVI